jgi:ABC-type dipeptide/oligopeptide/nickel transport system permease subunit
MSTSIVTFSFLRTYLLDTAMLVSRIVYTLLVRGRVRTISGGFFSEAALLQEVSDSRKMAKHILLNIPPPFMKNATLGDALGEVLDPQMEVTL